MSDLFLEQSDAILRIQLNRPAKKNAFSAEMYTSFADALDRAQSDDDVRVVLVHGAGDSFSAGNDLEDFAQHPTELEPQARFIQALIPFDKPLVAAVHGYAIGVGTTMLMHFDFVYAAPNARFQTPFVNLALVPEVGSSYMLPTELGYKAAAELVMLGRPIDAARAAELRLVTAVVPEAELLAVATDTARQLAAKPLGALRACKKLLRAQAVEHTERVSKDEEKEYAVRLKSDETKQAIRAFFERHRGKPVKKAG